MRTHEDKTTYSTQHDTQRKWKQITLTKKVDAGGYHRVDLWKDGKPKTWLVHRLVALAFLEKAEGKDVVNHIDGNPSNNNAENLEWCTDAENVNHAFDTGLMGTNKRTLLQNLSTGEVHEFRSMSKASFFLGRSHTYISNQLKKGRRVVGEYKIIS